MSSRAGIGGGWFWTLLPWNVWWTRLSCLDYRARPCTLCGRGLCTAREWVFPTQSLEERWTPGGTPGTRRLWVKESWRVTASRWGPGGGLSGRIPPWGQARIWTLRADPPGAAVGYSVSCAFFSSRALGKVSLRTESHLTLVWAAWASGWGSLEGQGSCCSSSGSLGISQGVLMTHSGREDGAEGSF